MTRLGKINELFDEGALANVAKATNVSSELASAALKEYTLYEAIEIQKLTEDYASRANAFNNRMVAASSARKNKKLKSLQDIIDDALEEDNDPKDDDLPLEEFSGSGAIGGGPSVPIGYTAKGKPETRAQRRRRQEFNVTKSFPYS
jgi:hypothetical protein